jgi:hypothetical protein
MTIPGDHSHQVVTPHEYAASVKMVQRLLYRIALLWVLTVVAGWR